MSGSVRILDESTIQIENFAYDGLGPDAYFIVGVETPVPPKRRPWPPVDAIPLPIYDNAELNAVQQPQLSFGSEEIPILGEYDIQDLTIKMPIGVSAYSIKWISVYCRDYKIDFGHAKFNSVPRN